MEKINLLWFKNDLRIEDNDLLYNNQLPSINFYILNDGIVGYSKWFLLQDLIKFQKTMMAKYNNFFIIENNQWENFFNTIKNQFNIAGIFHHHNYESYYKNLQENISNWSQNNNIPMVSYNNNYLINPSLVFNGQGTNYKIFTPFWKHISSLEIDKPVIPTIINYNCHLTYGNLENFNINIEKTYDVFLENHKFLFQYWIPGEDEAHNKLKFFIKNNLKDYSKLRDYPSISINSQLAPYLRNGNITSKQIYWSIKNIYNDTIGEPFLKQLGWRDFSYHLLYNYPLMYKENLKKQFDKFPWQWNENHWNAWCQGQTGYPIVDGGIQQLLKTGWIHNRVRMIVASFLTKDLRIHWSYGANFFLKYLMDADEANNSASWQWVAGSGMDAAPYYRIFNPIVQSRKFDGDGSYIKTWLPILNNIPEKYIHDPWNYDLSSYGIIIGKQYPWPIINHDIEKKISLDLYKNL